MLNPNIESLIQRRGAAVWAGNSLRRQWVYDRLLQFPEPRTKSRLIASPRGQPRATGSLLQCTARCISMFDSQIVKVFCSRGRVMASDNKGMPKIYIFAI